MIEPRKDVMAKRKPETRIERMLRSDGALCLTFVNTGLGKRKALETYGDLLGWGVETGAVSAADAPRLEQAAAESPDLAAGAARGAAALRARLERILVAVTGGRAPTSDDFEAFNVELGATFRHRRLDDTAAGFRWTWENGDGEDRDRMLWPVLLSAAELLVSEDFRRVRQCPNKGCGLLFVARGSGRPRIWCGAACRDRGTSRKHYQKVIKPQRERLASEEKAKQKARLAGYEDS